MRKVVTVVGARPQFVKASAVSRELRPRATEVLVHTGQHYDESMSGVFFRELGIPEPDVNLGVGSGPHGRQTGAMLAGVEEVLLRESPDWLLVYGDTNSTLAAALAAAKLHIPVAHVEAGVRSYNRLMPEEINRVLTDQIADLLLCPNAGAVENLKREGVVAGVHEVGDVMMDVLLHYRPVALQRADALGAWGVSPGGYALLTLHRAENVDDPQRLRDLLAAIGRMRISVVFPAHPRTVGRIREFGLDALLSSGYVVLDPVGYLDAITLAANARIVLTDSGGVQREACFLGTPCIVLRAETEWPELVGSGASRLLGPSFDALLRERWEGWGPSSGGDAAGAGASRRVAELLVG